MSSFKTSRNIPAPPVKIFAAIENPSRLAKWWGPNGFTNKIATFEFKPGGKWFSTMIGPDGKSYANESVFGAIEQDRKVVVKHVSVPTFVLTIHLQATPTGTLVTWEQVFDDPAVANAFRHIVEPANEQNLDRLGAEVQL